MEGTNTFTGNSPDEEITQIATETNIDAFETTSEELEKLNPILLAYQQAYDHAVEKTEIQALDIYSNGGQSADNIKEVRKIFWKALITELPKEIISGDADMLALDNTVALRIENSSYLLIVINPFESSRMGEWFCDSFKLEGCDDNESAHRLTKNHYWMDKWRMNLRMTSPACLDFPSEWENEIDNRLQCDNPYFEDPFHYFVQESQSGDVKKDEKREKAFRVVKKGEVNFMPRNE